ncbi:Thimet oligopeptidase [Trametes pubescens]|uniref:Thimet oligopeptidase n=1 Tax=Trametes pubescens TaxID=154538 RepID=A0A1M2VVB7_TRAPU|nr:Thimet oligopeptidase [Trametes pubescens]
MSTFDPPQPSPKWTHTPEEVRQLAEAAITDFRDAEDRVAALQPEDCNFDSVFLALALAEGKRIATVEPLAFYQNVSPSQELRDAANAAEIAVKDFLVDSAMRLDVFRAKQAAKKNIEESGRVLSSEERRLMYKMILDGTRAGLALPDAEREQLTRLNKELSQACSEFPHVLSGYTKRTEGGQEVYDITFQFQDILPLLKFAENPETRRVAYQRFDGRLATNEPMLGNILDLRRQVAKLLGYSTWADYVTEVKMVKSGKGVDQFLTDIREKLSPVGLKDREAHLALKKKEHEAKGYPFDGEYYAWDSKYYDRLYVEESLSLDDQLVKEYFPVSFVVPAILEIYQNLLGVKFIQIEGETWHADVQQYAVWEKDTQDASDFLGYCYLDIYPRESKYQGAAVWPLIPGHDKADGTRCYPVAAIVANLAKPATTERPALITHSDMVMFFHEIGHLFHELLSHTRFARFHGTTVALDFGEAPSQMLENWCYEPKVLERMSSHYETKKPLNSELIQKIIQSRYVNVGLFYLNQVSFSAFDLTVHMDQEQADLTQLWNEQRELIALLKGNGLRGGPGAFGHIAGGYDVGYYGYLYSLVFAADMYATVFKKDPLDPERGRRYRETVLRPGSSKDEIDLLKVWCKVHERSHVQVANRLYAASQDFLGREPTSEAFIRQLFGEPSA